jgi:hypothetical protein
VKVGAFVYGVQDSLVFYAVTAPFHYAAADVAEESIFIILASPLRVVTCVNRSEEPDMAPVTAPSVLVFSTVENLNSALDAPLTVPASLSMAEAILVTWLPRYLHVDRLLHRQVTTPQVVDFGLDLEEVRVALRGARYARERTLQHLLVLGRRPHRADHHHAEHFS